MSDLAEIYCSLTPEELRNRRSHVRATIVPQVVRATSLANGLRLDFGSSEGLRDLVEEFVVFEQGCCSFLTFTLSEPAEELSLLIQGPSNASHVIEMFRGPFKGRFNERSN